ncbi:unnamed protein product [Symbiodinium necroappetens]|uniref:Uncharacterized protein n=1 Tax=Symbiodinium necroappetens TaxID=1628268 RepID=A0A813A9B7_9DINO|nr:unnamed protein product [Symbiodinium necroappetens]
MIAGQDVEACVKCIKFLEQPGVDQLARELDLCSQVFEGLCGHPSWVDACYSYSKTWGLQLEARADDTSALGGSFAAVEGTVEVVSTDTVSSFARAVEDAGALSERVEGAEHPFCTSALGLRDGPCGTEAEAPVGAPTDRPAEKDEEGIPWQRLESRRKPGLFYYFNPLDGSHEIKPPVVEAPWQLCRSRSVSGQYYYYNQACPTAGMFSDASRSTKTQSHECNCSVRMRFCRSVSGSCGSVHGSWRFLNQISSTLNKTAALTHIPDGAAACFYYRRYFSSTAT